MPRATRGGLGILGGAGLEEVGVLDAVEHGREPGYEWFFHAVDLRQA